MAKDANLPEGLNCHKLCYLSTSTATEVHESYARIKKLTTTGNTTRSEECIEFLERESPPSERKFSCFRLESFGKNAPKMPKLAISKVHIRINYMHTCMVMDGMVGTKCATNAHQLMHIWFHQPQPHQGVRRLLCIKKLIKSK